MIANIPQWVIEAKSDDLIKVIQGALCDATKFCNGILCSDCALNDDHPEKFIEVINAIEKQS